jgi:uncharacterized protein
VKAINADQMLPGSQIFLSAEWCDLVMLNYEIESRLLQDYLPAGTTVDSFEGKTYVSLVGFQFRRTRVLGALAIPFHSAFDEVNLRFYVRCKQGSGERRGVVFIAEIVPRRAVALIARYVYGENYVCSRMRHRISTTATTKAAEYEWQLNGSWCRLYAQASAPAIAAEQGSLEEFITEHYWGYSRQRDGSALEYNVSHVPWSVWRTTAAGFEGDASNLYGAKLGSVLQRRPDSAFIADGSSVKVFKGKRI